MRRKMSRSLFSLKFVFFFSLSLTASYTVTSTPTFYSFRKLKLRSSSASPSVPKASAADLLALLVPPQQALAVNSQEARQPRSCFKFLVPFSPSYQTPNRRSLSSKLSDDRRSINEENELIWWPPAPVMELARLAVDSGGDAASIQRTLDPTVVPVPDIRGSKEDRCELTRTPYGRLFINEEINSYLESLFEMIVAQGPNVGLNVSLSRFDFFHGHVFLSKDSGRLGILFHAKEYPAYDKEVFPCNMGYCQIGVLVVLDARPTGVIYKDLIPEYVQIAGTLYEDDFGDVAFDVNYLNTGGEPPKFQIFIC
ncbi:hypothetical protein H5410_047902 [Solanum commersonii]|uniref:Uncharacterized protein n=1 Tax=Solanum commersonii TaxID=4109 RepID=A0A9J5XJL1_SOLCO|nr:hypothetical protein H5410_047902 [Solanum commersonii]